ncbi:MAG: phosphoribosyltransferase [bacterium]
MRFIDRREAGEKLAEKLALYRGEGAVILAVPRGGVVIGAALAEKLGGSLDLVIARKIGLPGNPEFAIGAVGEDGTLLLADLPAHFGVNDEYLRTEVERQTAEIKRRRELYTGGREALSLQGKTAILADDGIATGFTTRAVIAAARRREPARLILAVPVLPPDVLEQLRPLVDEVVYLAVPTPFYAVGMFYRDFEQITDTEVIQIMEEASRFQSSVGMI